MIEYNCPQCDKIMIYIQEWTAYSCETCNIYYFNKKNGGNFNSDYLGNKLLVKGSFFTEGTFEYCYRSFKLKAFS